MAQTTGLADLKPVYLIHGKEPVKLDEAVRRLRARLEAEADLDFNLDVFDGPSASVDHIIAAANTLPFMSERRLVIVRDVDSMSAHAVAALAEYAANPAPYTCLVMTAADVSKSSVLYRAVDALGGVAEYKKPKAYEYPREVVALFRKRNIAIDGDAAGALVDAVGADLRRLTSEVDKIASYAGDATTLSRDDIEDVLEQTAPVHMWHLTDAIGARDAEGALRVLARLLAANEEPVRIVASVVSYVRKLIGVNSFAERGESATAVARRFRLRDWQANQVITQARRFSEGELTAALRSLAEVDLNMKTSLGDPRLALERWIVGVCRGAG
jgi:DNA polymerase III subunit delta